MKDSEKRQFVELIKRITWKEVSDALDQHLRDYEHKEKPTGRAL